jgi:pyridoxal phosphate enzyme (YggS family)
MRGHQFSTPLQALAAGASRGLAGCRANICAVAVDKSALESNLALIQERITRAAERSGRRAEEITIVAVSKTFSVEAVLVAHELGLRHFGENRVQEFDSKRETLADLDATFHLIGHLQGNKARRAAEIFDAIDSVDSISLARKLDGAWSEDRKANGSKLPVLIEVQLAAEDSKFGVTEADLPILIEAILQLMAIPPYLENPEDVRPYFRRLRELRDEIRQRFRASAADSVHELSMGMSHDFEVAIEEGATQIRVGTALFGGRVAR